MELTKTQIEIIKLYLKILITNQNPSFSDMIKLGVSTGKVVHHFGNIKELRKAAKQFRPDAFKNIIDEDTFSPDDKAKLEKVIKKNERFVITTAVTGCKVHKGAYEAVKSYCKKKKAKTLILPVTDPAARAGWKLDPILDNDTIVYGNIPLNDNIKVRSIKLSAKHLDPITQFARMAQKDGSFIFGSPKQRMKMFATSAEKLPHVLMTTGAITLPDYSTDKYMSERLAELAAFDHKMGAIIVEIVDSRIYHFRQIQFDKKGSFIDLGVMYHADGTTEKVRAKAFSLGDYHSGQTDPVADKAWLEVIDKVGVDEVIFHDLFNALSINHHESKMNLLRAKRAMAGELDLTSEFEGVVKDIKKYLAKVKRCIIAKSNHDDMIDRWLELGTYLKDAPNCYIGHKLALAVLEDRDPFKEAIEELCEFKNENVIFLSMDQDYKIAGIECGAHGHLGVNGAKGTLAQMEAAYGASQSGHTHTAEILRDAWQNATSSILRMGYNKGASSWIHNSTLIYPNGMRQMINVIYGQWHLED